MKKVLIIGATGSLAKVVTKTLKQLPDIELTLFARNKNRIVSTAQAQLFEGDALNYDDLNKAVKGQDIVYINLAGNLEAMARNIVKAMKSNGVSRIIAISSIGIYDTPLRSVLVPYRKLADIIEASGIDYTILRPDWFTNGEEIDYALTQKGEAETGTAVSRKSIAAFVARIIGSPDEYKNQNLGISRPK